MSKFDELLDDLTTAKWNAGQCQKIMADPTTKAAQRKAAEALAKKLGKEISDLTLFTEKEYQKMNNANEKQAKDATAELIAATLAKLSAASNGTTAKPAKPKPVDKAKPEATKPAPAIKMSNDTTPAPEAPKAPQIDKATEEAEARRQAMAKAAGLTITPKPAINIFDMLKDSEKAAQKAEVEAVAVEAVAKEIEAADKAKAEAQTILDLARKTKEEAAELFEKAKAMIDAAQKMKEEKNFVQAGNSVSAGQITRTYFDAVTAAKAAGCTVKKAGEWTWIDGVGKDDLKLRETLKAAKFQWSSKRGQWYHKPAV